MQGRWREEIGLGEQVFARRAHPYRPDPRQIAIAAMFHGERYVARNALIGAGRTDALDTMRIDLAGAAFGERHGLRFQRHAASRAERRFDEGRRRPNLGLQRAGGVGWQMRDRAAGRKGHIARGAPAGGQPAAASLGAALKGLYVFGVSSPYSSHAASDHGQALFDWPRQPGRRAREHGDDFLRDRLVEDIALRLSLIAREFPTSLHLGRHGPFLRAALKAMGKADRATDLWIDQALEPGQSGAGLVGGAAHVPIAPGRLSLVTALADLSFVNDLPGLLAQIRLALAPDGVFIGVLFGQGDAPLWRAALTQAELETTGKAAARVPPLVDVQSAAHLLQRAGFALPVADRQDWRIRYTSGARMVADWRAMGWRNPLAKRAPLRRGALASALTVFEAGARAPDGRIGLTIETITITGWAPHASQQQPLAPGSAKMRLAEALGVDELSAGEAAPRRRD